MKELMIGGARSGKRLLAEKLAAQSGRQVIYFATAQAEPDEAIDCPLLADETRLLIDSLAQPPGHIILVSNEVGWSVVPMHPMSRLFADEQSRLRQHVAVVCEQVTLVAAGLPLKLKG